MDIKLLGNVEKRKGSMWGFVVGFAVLFCFVLSRLVLLSCVAQAELEEATEPKLASYQPSSASASKR